MGACVAYWKYGDGGAALNRSAQNELWFIWLGRWPKNSAERWRLCVPPCVIA